MSEILAFLDWEKRPAVITIIGDAYAVVSENGDWEKTDRTEVIDNSRIISAEAFSTLFPYADLSTVLPNSEYAFHSSVFLAAEILKMADEFTVVDWEARPAVLAGWGRAFAILSADGSWEQVKRPAVEDRGKPISADDFSKLFPYADLSTIPPYPWPPPSVMLAAALKKMTEEIKLINWESRPAAILKSGLAFAVLDATSGWVKVSATEVSESGNPISVSTFKTMFPKSDLNKIPGIPDLDANLATLDKTTTVPRARALSSSEDEGPHEYLRTYKASEDRWAADALKAVVEKKRAAGELPEQQKAKKEDKDR
jgi:hypothetical protein